MSGGSLRRWLMVGLAAVSCAALVDRAEAQRFGRGPTPGAGACFYQDPDFQASTSAFAPATGSMRSPAT
jgi:hypothetical protein